MRICGIVAEYNPFHNGHRALVDEARAAGATHVAAVMSGNFVQRADFAVTDKRVRAACAMQAGVDLVLELPLPWATATAHQFARGALEILRAAGCVDMLAFGSECADLEVLRTVAAAVDDPAVLARMRELLGDGLAFARARHLAVGERLGADVAAPLGSPNDLLGIEYLRQARLLGWAPDALAVRRRGAGHDAQRAAGGYASASYLRKHAGSFSQLGRYMPASCAKTLRAAADDGLFPADPRRLDVAVLAHLRRLDRAAMQRLPDLSEGLENRLYAASRTAASLDALYALLKVKRYPLSRVRRLVLAAFLGITAEDVAGSPPYLRVLAMNARGREVAAAMKRGCALPHGTSLAKLSRENAACARLAALEARGTDLWALALPAPLPCGYEYSASAVFEK